MSGFFEYCVKCRKMFQNEADWNKHLRTHRQPKTMLKPFDMAEQKVKIEAANVPGADPVEIEDERIAKTQGLRAIKKILKEAGAECSTMNAEEAKELYNRLKAEGKVK